MFNCIVKFQENTISRWLLTVMGNAGIECNKFKIHNIRSASTSKAKQQFVSIDKILNVAHDGLIQKHLVLIMVRQ